MSTIETYRAFYKAHEHAVLDNDWSKVGAFLTEDTDYEVIGDPPLGNRKTGRQKILDGFVMGLDAFDRRFESRAITPLEGPVETANRVWVRWRMTLSVTGAPPFVLEGEETVTIADGRVVRLENRFPDGTGARMMQWIKSYNHLLAPDPTSLWSKLFEWQEKQ